MILFIAGIFIGMGIGLFIASLCKASALNSLVSELQQKILMAEANKRGPEAGLPIGNN